MQGQILKQLELQCVPPLYTKFTDTSLFERGMSGLTDLALNFDFWHHDDIDVDMGDEPDWDATLFDTTLVGVRKRLSPTLDHGSDAVSQF
jgi:hypothetical protein